MHNNQFLIPPGPTTLGGRTRDSDPRLIGEPFPSVGIYSSSHNCRPVYPDSHIVHHTSPPPPVHPITGHQSSSCHMPIACNGLTTAMLKRSSTSKPEPIISDPPVTKVSDPKPNRRSSLKLNILKSAKGVTCLRPGSPNSVPPPPTTKTDNSSIKLTASPTASHWNLRYSNLLNYPKYSTRKKAGFERRVKHTGLVLDPHKTLCLIRRFIQPFINRAVDAVIQQYVNDYIRVAVKNIQQNLGEDAINETDIAKIQRSIIKHLALYYLNRRDSDAKDSVEKEKPTPACSIVLQPQPTVNHQSADNSSRRRRVASNRPPSLKLPLNVVDSNHDDDDDEQCPNSASSSGSTVGLCNALSSPSFNSSCSSSVSRSSNSDGTSPKDVHHSPPMVFFPNPAVPSPLPEKTFSLDTRSLRRRQQPKKSRPNWWSPSLTYHRLARGRRGGAIGRGLLLSPLSIARRRTRPSSRQPQSIATIKKSKQHTSLHRQSGDQLNSNHHLPSSFGPSLDQSTEFTLGSSANAWLGMSAARGRIYTKHPQLFRYLCQPDDKTWLVESGLLAGQGAKAFIMLASQVKAVHRHHDNSRSSLNKSPPTSPDDSKQLLPTFCLPKWLLEKVCTAFNDQDASHRVQSTSKHQSTTTTETASTTNDNGHSPSPPQSSSRRGRPTLSAATTTSSGGRHQIDSVKEEDNHVPLPPTPNRTTRLSGPPPDLRKPDVKRTRRSGCAPTTTTFSSRRLLKRLRPGTDRLPADSSTTIKSRSSASSSTNVDNINLDSTTTSPPALDRFDYTSSS